MATPDEENPQTIGNIFLQESGRSNTSTAGQADNDNCVICLQSIIDRTILPQCSHDCHCFACILEWIKHSNKCPLCVADIGPYIIHNVRSKHDYKRHFISPTLSPRNSDRAYLVASNVTRERRASMAAFQRSQQRRREEARRKQEEDAALAMRRYVYQNVLYAKHVASNRYTRYTPHPSPAQVSASAELQSRATAFLRRELRVWSNLDVEFLTSYIVMMIKTLDLRSEGGIKILSELLDPNIPYTEEGRHPNTEHLAHELYSFLRSPYKSVEMYDKHVQYETVVGRPSRPLETTSQSLETRGSQSSPRLAENSIKQRPSRWDQKHPTAKRPPPTIELPETRIDQQSEEQAQFEMGRGNLRRDEMSVPASQPSEELRHEPSETQGPTTQISMAKKQHFLSRLQEEKSLIVSNQMDGEEGSPDTAGAARSSGIQIRGAAAKAREGALQKLEERLRSQALLRVRLTREKAVLLSRAHSDTKPAPNNARLDNGEQFSSSPVEKADLLKERLLRERLLLSRQTRA